MKVALIEYPGSTGFKETFRIFSELAPCEPYGIWHAEESLKDPDLVVVPGGFAYGDYLRPGALAKLSPASGLVKRFATKGGKVVGIGNGFQLLCELGLLPGALLSNSSLCFDSSEVHLKVEKAESELTAGFERKEPIQIPLGCYFGRYWADKRALKELEENGKIFLRYVNKYGDFDPDNTYNDSAKGIAGILSRHGNVLGMMPHPERAFESYHVSTHGRELLEHVVSNLGSGATEVP